MVEAFHGRSVGVFGLARSGLSSVRALKAGGADVYAFDSKEELREAARAAGAKIVSWEEWPWDRLGAVILSPGVPLTHPKPHDVVLRARDWDVDVIGDIELFARTLPDVPLIAITGTNGKSTTTALIGHILKETGFDAQVGGNIGQPVLDLEPPGARTIYVIEISSYQIDLSPGLAPEVSVLTNITPDHIDRHGSLEGYAAVKKKLLQQTRKSGLNIVGVDDDFTASIFTQLSSNGGAPCVAVSVGKVLGRGIFVLDGALYNAQNDRATKVMELSAATHLPGTHNWQNAAVAYAAVKPYVTDARALAAAIVSFPGLTHRIEDVGSVGKVRFINDSKATNADAAERALVCFDDIFWIIGGRAKAGGITSLEPHFHRIRKAYLIGDAAEEFAATLKGKVEFEHCGTLAKAVVAAASDAAHFAAEAPVVLLSPACASFDQFKDFEERGEAFRAAVLKLKPEAA
ncbi:UDP-N-acetylmuramoylalanine--D-glutamate ligase [Rhizomicrobium palustre]|uniref:UDP-N-acetylmuramoylalanine--D-glutamate ligase n=1 Tax=Rhizomicrobium palustre TaxID=189966 RepID=A0A846MVW9_9PROT|nr:UDP-N-acetylmuramoylalanine--D-glutamate ligase [Rhizomicrobium palustre]